MKHAYLIVAHNDFSLLEKLVVMLDRENNDIYIHIDKKVGRKTFEKLSGHLRDITKKTEPVFIERRSIYWGSSAMIDVELMLLRKAAESHHDYYHLLSGADLPIKKPEEIDAFFAKNAGTEFVSVDEPETGAQKWSHRVRYYSFGPLSAIRIPYFGNLNLLSRRIQKRIGIDRLKKVELLLMKGSTWFDITHEFAEYLLRRMSDKKLSSVFRYGSCADEMFVQTVLWDSPFRERRYAGECRFIDWSGQGNHPETLTSAYWEPLLQSEAVFARKFSTTADPEIIGKVFDAFR